MKRIGKPTNWKDDIVFLIVALITIPAIFFIILFLVKLFI